MTTAHQHEATLEDALDFINTLHIEEDAPDHLAELGAGTEWLAQRGLLHERRDGRLPGVDDEGTNTRIRGCRDAMRALFDATVEGHRVSRDVLDELVPKLPVQRERAGVLDDHLEPEAPQPARPRLVVDGPHHRLADPSSSCPGNDPETCRWAFRDSSPTGRRRWCDMASCGNRAKAARHRARVRAATSAPARPGADAVGNADVARA